MIQLEETGSDRSRDGDPCAISQESQATQFGLNLLLGVVADIELREYREGLAVKHTARMRCPLVQVGERMADPSSSEMTGDCAFNGALDVRFEERVSNDHGPTIMAAALDWDPEREVPVAALDGVLGGGGGVGASGRGVPDQDAGFGLFQPPAVGLLAAMVVTA